MPNAGFATHTRAKRKTDGHSIAIHPTVEPSAGPHPGRKWRPYGAGTKNSSGKTMAAATSTTRGATCARGWMKSQNEVIAKEPAIDRGDPAP